MCLSVRSSYRRAFLANSLCTGNNTSLICWSQSRVWCQRRERVLRYPKLRERHRSTEAELAEFVRLFTEKGRLVTPQATPRVITADVSDNLYLEMAVAGDAQYIVSGDRHLLQLQEYQGIPILTPAEFLGLILRLQSEE